MRKGINPEKQKTERNVKYFHRIVIPVYIPNITESYYKEALEVFKSCLFSVFKTINKKTTAITVVNNNSSREIEELINTYLKEGLIDKIVNYKENRGKVYAAVSEARGVYEPFVTIADADVLFFSGWEREVFSIFKNFPKAGVVSPLPAQNLTFYKNASVFFDNIMRNRIKYGKKVSDWDCNLFIKGMGNPALYRRNNRTFSWKEKQYYIGSKVPAIIGANHFVATYRKEIFHFNQEFPFLKFQNGYEEKFLDEPADKFGWYRLSTSSSFAYHLGNNLDIVSNEISFNSSKEVDPDVFRYIKVPRKSRVPYWIKDFVFKVLKRIKQL